MKKCLLTTTGVALMLMLLTSCATDSAAPQPNASAAEAAKAAAAHAVKHDELLIPAAKINAIAKGLKTDQVRELLGAPHHVAPFTAGAVTGEVWIYRISVSEIVEQVPTSFVDVPAWDPLSNRPITVKSPVYSMMHVQTFQTLELLMVDGRLVERKAGRDSDRAYY